MNRQLWLLGGVAVPQVSIGISNTLSLAMHGSVMGIIAAALPLGFAALLGFGFIRVNGLKRRLVRARRLYES